VRRRYPLALGSVVALTAAAPAAAAEVVVNAVDPQAWDNPSVAIAAGDSVTWKFDGTSQPLTHNVQADAKVTGDTPWQFYSPPGTPATLKFDTPGRYRFACVFHEGSMFGYVTVGNPPPPPPPPLSEQPFVNDSAITPAGYETGGGLDTAKPRLRSVKAKQSRKRVKVSFRVNEQSVVTVRLTRGRKTVKTKRAATGSRGSVTVAGLKPGRYAVKVVATDVAGNASSSRRASFRIR